MKKLASLFLLAIGIYIVFSNIGGEVLPIVGGMTLGAIGASWYGVIRKQEKAENEKAFWPDDQEYR